MARTRSEPFGQNATKTIAVSSLLHPTIPRQRCDILILFFHVHTHFSRSLRSLQKQPSPTINSITAKVHCRRTPTHPHTPCYVMRCARVTTLWFGQIEEMHRRKKKKILPGPIPKTWFCCRKLRAESRLRGCVEVGVRGGETHVEMVMLERLSSRSSTLSTLS